MTPYFTTKTKGTGLGLPIVNKIINEHKTKPTRRIQTIKNAPVIGGRLLPPGGGQTCTPGGKRARFRGGKRSGHDFLIFFFLLLRYKVY